MEKSYLDIGEVPVGKCLWVRPEMDEWTVYARGAPTKSFGAGVRLDNKPRAAKNCTTAATFPTGETDE